MKPSPNYVLFACLIAASCGLIGCSKSEPSKNTASANTAKATDANHDHSDWWCNEHGVPEEICAQCSAKVAAEFQKKGDWCKEHNRPDSQCFKCHPELEAKFAAKYVAKYGKQPPKPE
jgi:major membrane immunogen (membrane-anchored lipoprotein)